ncbi:2-hydroxyacid dehydrogenase [Aureitalea sp. L0-47]|uniref:NAD(P)-dependent oxidoreductase n=1 Tax=Aureitalea sp. L0-47 TaxID=2816962 RepID=UPI0022372F05|nr:NAD(P)-dependent oxidoreductase [Aureitalea sp. L0-47]MCW5519809.1 2-hydroxyacid dehydrogenase [Aureitalea sp. L0-47]
MKVLIYSSKDFEIPYLKAANTEGLEVIYTRDRLTTNTAMKALGYDAISIFSADDASTNVLEKLHDFGVKYVALRSTGYDNIHLKTAEKFNIRVAHAPAYSPYAIAEHAMALLLALNRKIVRAHEQMKEQDFTLSSLIGFDLYRKKVGVLGTGAIGSVVVRLLHGFGCEIYANDLKPNLALHNQYGVTYLSKQEMQGLCDVLMVCLPLTSETYHLLDSDVISGMKDKSLVVNIARGAIVHTPAILDALDSGKLGGYASDVYDKESGVYFYDRRGEALKDSNLKKLIDHPNVVLTPHQAFATVEALEKIAETTFHNLNSWNTGKSPEYEL